jgi:hypothetical protein
MNKIVAAAVSALLLGSGAALAQAAEGPWTQEEFVSVYPDVTPETYVLIDTNGDGLIDQDELDAAIAAGLVVEQPG